MDESDEIEKTNLVNQFQSTFGAGVKLDTNESTYQQLILLYKELKNHSEIRNEKINLYISTLREIPEIAYINIKLLSFVILFIETYGFFIPRNSKEKDLLNTFIENRLYSIASFKYTANELSKSTIINIKINFVTYLEFLRNIFERSS